MLLHDKSREVCIKARSTPASLPFRGQVTKQTTAKCLLDMSTLSKCKSLSQGGTGVQINKYDMAKTLTHALLGWKGKLIILYKYLPHELLAFQWITMSDKMHRNDTVHPSGHTFPTKNDCWPSVKQLLVCALAKTCHPAIKQQLCLAVSYKKILGISSPFCHSVIPICLPIIPYIWYESDTKVYELE